MKPQELKTKIFLDGGDPQETREIRELLGFLDGQTTNPTLIAKNPLVQARLARGERFTKEEIYALYRDVVREISRLIPEGSVSVEVYADAGTSAEDMITEGVDMFLWIPNAHVKFPINPAGLAAAEILMKSKIHVNMTLCFTEEQAAAVHAATRGAALGNVFVSPFVGRLDDCGINGMQLVENILGMYRDVGGHVQVLTASVRSLAHFMRALQLGSDIITAPAGILREWAEARMPLPGPDFVYHDAHLAPIQKSTLDLSRPARKYKIAHELTDAGIARFASDWNALIA